MTKAIWEIERDERDATIDAALTDWSIEIKRIPDTNPVFKDLKLKYHFKLYHKGLQVIEGPYSMGIGHIPSYEKWAQKLKGGSWQRDTLAWVKFVRECCGHGRVPQFLSNLGIVYKGGTKILPEKRDVIFCLAQDSSALEARDFADWASDYGYDTDSIKAKKTYEACLETAMHLKAAVGYEGLQALRDLFQDY